MAVLRLADGTVGWGLASASTSSSAFEGGQALYHGYLPLLQTIVV